MRLIPPLFASVLLIAVQACDAAPADKPVAASVHQDEPPDPVAAPVYYNNQAMVVATKDGTAIIVFKEPINDKGRDGRHYQFRFIGRDGKEVRGEGAVYEHKQRPPVGESGIVVDLGSKTDIVANKIKLEWSLGGTEQGWIYYRPEDTRVQFVAADEFEKIDISRFRK